VLKIVVAKGGSQLFNVAVSHAGTSQHQPTAPKDDHISWNWDKWQRNSQDPVTM